MKLYLCHFHWKFDCNISIYLYASLVNFDWEGKQISCFYSGVTKDHMDADVMFSLDGKLVTNKGRGWSLIWMWMSGWAIVIFCQKDLGQ